MIKYIDKDMRMLSNGASDKIQSGWSHGIRWRVLCEPRFLLGSRAGSVSGVCVNNKKKKLVREWVEVM